MTPSQTQAGNKPVAAQVLLAAELATLERELPRLLAEGQEGRWALVKGNDVVSIWDTFADAVQAGDLQFGLEPFMVDKVLAQPRVVRSRMQW